MRPRKRLLNIYALEKINDLLGGLSTGVISNAVNCAVIKTMLATPAISTHSLALAFVHIALNLETDFEPIA